MSTRTHTHTGKNTTIRKAIRGHLDQNPSLEKLLPHIKGNVGFVFTNEDLSDVRDIIMSNRVSCTNKEIVVIMIIAMRGVQVCLQGNSLTMCPSL